MADKFEREIEEILARLDDQLPAGQKAPERPPVSIAAKRKQKARAERVSRMRSAPLLQMNPANILVAGAVVMVAGLILSTFAGPFIWLSLAGVVMFLAAFLLSFRRTSRPGAAAEPRGYFWRDRYIEYGPTNPGPGTRIKGWFRRK